MRLSSRVKNRYLDLTAARPWVHFAFLRGRKGVMVEVALDSIEELSPSRD